MRLAIERVAGRRPWPPRCSEFTERFWRALAEGRLTTTRCAACARLAFPPRPFCPHCWHRSVEWVELRPGGTVYSSTVVHAAPAVFAHEAPYRVGIVDLDDGLRIATRLLGVAEGFAVGARAELVVLAYDDGPLFAARVRG
ncbi:MAG: Zn-ribbon domain-containing OB-fold protein [Burkholderiales bacterium]|nr:Zn-ribbon domain-containing OB-fold protein [Burkholderiales bacterium]